MYKRQVEDSRLIRTTMKRILVEAGFGVVDVSDGEKALQLARQSRPDLIILDMLLPVSYTHLDVYKRQPIRCA